MRQKGISLGNGILEWASKDHDTEALNIKFPKFKKWLKREDEPTFNELEKLANYLGFPFGYFFLTRPLELKQTENIDFRTIKNRLGTNMSVNLRCIIEKMKYLQEWESDYYKKNKLGKVNLNCPSKDDYNLLTQQIYKILDIPNNWFKEYKDVTKAFNYIRRKMEEKRITVVVAGKIDDNTHKILNVDEFRAFALYDDYAPLIFINAQDAPSGRLFSLVHEFVHILRGEADIVGEAHFFEEAKCNGVAIRFLAPENYISEYINSSKINENKIHELSNMFKISYKAMCYRLNNLKYISETECMLYIKEEANKRDITGYKHKKQGGNYWNTKLNVLSKHVVQSIISEVYNGNLTYTECFKMLGLSGLKTFKKFEVKFKENKI